MSSWLQKGDIQDYDSILEPVQTMKLFGLDSYSRLCACDIFLWLSDETRRKTGWLFTVKLETVKDVKSQNVKPIGSQGCEFIFVAAEHKYQHCTSQELSTPRGSRDGKKKHGRRNRKNS